MKAKKYLDNLYTLKDEKITKMKYSTDRQLTKELTQYLLVLNKYISVVEKGIEAKKLMKKGASDTDYRKLEISVNGRKKTFGDLYTFQVARMRALLKIKTIDDMLRNHCTRTFDFGFKDFDEHLEIKLPKQHHYVFYGHSSKGGSLIIDTRKQKESKDPVVLKIMDKLGI